MGIGGLNKMLKMCQEDVKCQKVKELDYGGSS